MVFIKTDTKTYCKILRGYYMDDKIIQEYEKLKKQKEKQLKRQNEYNKINYDRITILLPKGQKAALEEIAKNRGFKSVTDYIKVLIDQDKTKEALKQDFGSEQLFF